MDKLGQEGGDVGEVKTIVLIADATTLGGGSRVVSVVSNAREHFCLGCWSPPALTNRWNVLVWAPGHRVGWPLRCPSHTRWPRR